MHRQVPKLNMSCLPCINLSGLHSFNIFKYIWFFFNLKKWSRLIVLSFSLNDCGRLHCTPIWEVMGAALRFLMKVFFLPLPFCSLSSSSVVGCASPPTFSSTDPASSSFHHPILHPFASSPASGAQVRGPNLPNLGTFAPHPSAPPAIEVTAPSPNIEKKQARVLYDYEAKDLTEISLTEDEVLSLYLENKFISFPSLVSIIAVFVVLLFVLLTFLIPHQLFSIFYLIL